MRSRLIFGEAWRSLSANVSTTVAATVTVLIGMFLLGLFVALGTWVVSWSNHVKKELLVKVYFADAAGPRQFNAVGSYLTTNPLMKADVKSFTFISKQQALQTMERKYPDLTKDLPYNPLPNSIQITPTRAEFTAAVGGALRSARLPGIQQPVSKGVRWGEQTANRILSVAKVIESIFLVAVIVLLGASTLLIANTIRLSIFSRRREIEVMKLVGATNWFVRGPFMLEGLLCGFAGSLAAIVLLLLGKEVALPAILGHIDSGSDVHAWPFSVVALLLVGTGLALGVMGSGLTIRRFLKV